MLFPVSSNQLTSIVYYKIIIHYTKAVIIQTHPISLNDTHVVIVSLAVCVSLTSSLRHQIIIHVMNAQRVHRSEKIRIVKEHYGQKVGCTK